VTSWQDDISQEYTTDHNKKNFPGVIDF
jgi:hypothetical protein